MKSVEILLNKKGDITLSKLVTYLAIAAVLIILFFMFRKMTSILG